jgi:hypothetical protein
MWIDDMYMLIILQLQAYRAAGDPKYLDRAALEMTTYLDKLQQPNGLFYHAPDVPFYWGRGDGWVAVGMAEMLSELPPDHPQRARITEGYKKMMAAVAHVSLIGILSSIIRVPLILAKGTSDVTLSPAAFLPVEQHTTFFYHLLSQLDIFAIWMLGLSALAISVIAGVPTRKATTAVVILWIVLMPIFALLQTKLGGAGS